MPIDLTSEQWAQLLSMLSLDGALSLYDVMGVPVDDKGAFHEALREVINEARSVMKASPNYVPSPASMLLDRLDRTTRERFLAWARGVFLGYHADQPQWSAWDIVFSHWAYSRARDLDFLPEAKREFFLAGYREKVETDDVKRKAKELLNKPMSDWDLEIYARHGYGIAWESTPFSLAEAITRIERLKGFAAQFWKRLDASERGESQRRAQALIDELKVWMPGPLPKLEDLLRDL
jgi:hypothetical protein